MSYLHGSPSVRLRRETGPGDASPDALNIADIAASRAALNRELVEYHEREVFSAAGRSGGWFVIDDDWKKAITAAHTLVAAGLWETHPTVRVPFKYAFRPLTPPGEGE